MQSTVCYLLLVQLFGGLNNDNGKGNENGKKCSTFFNMYYLSPLRNNGVKVSNFSILLVEGRELT